MAQLDAELIWEDGVHFVGTSPSGHTVHLDGDKTAGASPMELILLGLGGCASYDVVSIMKKSRQDITDVRCQMRAHRADTIPAVFTDIHLHFVVTGSNIKESQLAKAIELSAEKYCSASRMLSSGGVNITHDYEIVDV
ncbi:OsmC family protein [Moraxella catarrhalis]|uniref:OsmC/Ohr family protein n=1 Tax=Moraxella catarrhalis TaxID=480 RepID=A0A198UHF2_MORCA|nr:OsmC family protein [Moraxella catarrhalis]OAU95826.1 OsmC/Ohr family protein [Moraxella catarrhalis]OAU97884.1 OsmC/Ohr family protein [Moraxella catarrhalis]OAV04039.1 OsmC/Ohr family protein [Moraxella catarrhalis]